MPNDATEWFVRLLDVASAPQEDHVARERFKDALERWALESQTHLHDFWEVAMIWQVLLPYDTQMHEQAAAGMEANGD
jgi:hypothetical protein